MRGIILKDLLSLKKQFIPMFLFFGIYIFIAIMTKDSSFLTGVLMIFCAMLPITALSFDERSGFSKYALTMPISRSMLVISKYLVTVILISCGGVISLLFSLFIGSASFMESVWSVVIIMLLGSLMVSVSLPPIFKYGVEKGRFIVIGSIMVLGFFGGAAAMSVSKGKLSTTLDKYGILWGAKMDAFFNSGLSLISLLAVSVVILLISLSISLVIYRKKDF
ncbi:ABC-2 transporter permease [Aminipila luticellarii]|uniref:ABC-2 transporter permease n=1 Tax=Aminipila luticellarii TaxID=2507160 RepID=A0A410PYH8_9FIRM|nr:ABC-2 transporter permease [Aminipila luticellarii]QAT43935.1 ABC-2 transporter permease [Aminipila luticellarii]